MEPAEKPPRRQFKHLHLTLFVITCITTTMSGAEWIYGRSFIFEPFRMGWGEFFGGLEFSIPFLLFLTCHEFAHYFTAKYHQVKATLPYYIPVWFGIAPSIGTMGAFIRLKQRTRTSLQSFDIGIAGPLAGFVIGLIVLVIGFTQLPPKDYVLQVHPEYEAMGPDYEQYVYKMDTFILRSDVATFNEEYAQHLPDTLYYSQDTPSITLGSTILFGAMKSLVPASQEDRLPNVHEIMHYPWLLAGFLALVFTALNLMPIGQLDGGHVIFGLLGRKRHGLISRAFFIAFITYAGIGVVDPYEVQAGGAFEYLVYMPLYVYFLYYIMEKVTPVRRTRLMIAVAIFAFQYMLVQFNPEAQGYYGWLLFAFFIGRIVGMDYPETPYVPLDSKRKLLGWLTLVIFVISFSWQPLLLSVN